MWLSMNNVWPSSIFIRQVLISGAVQLAALTASAVPAMPVDRVVAVIDDDIITARELEAAAAPHLEASEQMQPGKERDAARKRALRHALDTEIDERLLTREIDKNRDKLGVSERDLDRAAQEVMRMNHMNEAQLEAALIGQGLSRKSYREKLRGQLERTRLIQFRVQGKVQVSEADVQRKCRAHQRSGAGNEQVCASHILLRIASSAKKAELDAQAAEAKALRQRAAMGEDFTALARAYSDDPGAKDGALGCFFRGEMMESFEQAAFALPVGGLSEVVRTPFGFHIIKVSARHTQQSKDSCDDPGLREEMRAELAQEQMQVQLAAYLRELRAKALVEVRL